MPNEYWHELFLLELRVCGIVKDAARAAHIDRNTAFAARRKALSLRAAGSSNDFAARWDEALAAALNRQEQVAWQSRAGVKRPVFRRGRRVV